MRSIKNLKNKITEMNDTRCRIEFEKSRLNPHKIALVGEFYFNAVKPMAQKEGSAFAQAYNRSGAQKHAELLKLWIATEGVDVFRVTSALVGTPLPSYTYKTLFGEDAGPIGIIPETMRKRGAVPGEYVRDAHERHQKWVGYTATYPAVRVSDMLKAMDWTLKPHLERREWGALLRGDGGTLVDFWHAVNGLRGFNREFEKSDYPDIGRRRPDFQKRKHISSPGRIWDWGPKPVGI